MKSSRRAVGGVSVGKKLRDSKKKNPKMSELIFLLEYIIIYTSLTQIFDIIVCLIHKIGMKKWHV